jgi:hypothetical protein
MRAHRDTHAQTNTHMHMHTHTRTHSAPLVHPRLLLEYPSSTLDIHLVQSSNTLVLH